MITNALDRCFSFINCQISPPKKPGRARATVKRAVTLSRLTGSGSHLVAEKLVENLQARAPAEGCQWTIFDKNLVEKVLEDHKLPARLGRFMQEDRISEISDTMDELFGLHPSSWTLVHKAAETILHLAELGNVIIIGRGANVITASMDHVFHVRLVGSVGKRVEHIKQRFEMSDKAAREFLRKEDEARRRFLTKYFDKNIDDPLLYHMVLNTDFVTYDQAAHLITEAVLAYEAPARGEADKQEQKHAPDRE